MTVYDYAGEYLKYGYGNVMWLSYAGNTYVIIIERLLLILT